MLQSGNSHELSRPAGIDPLRLSGIAGPFPDAQSLHVYACFILIPRLLQKIQFRIQFRVIGILVDLRIFRYVSWWFRWWWCRPDACKRSHHQYAEPAISLFPTPWFKMRTRGRLFVFVIHLENHFRLSAIVDRPACRSRGANRQNDGPTGLASFAS